MRRAPDGQVATSATSIVSRLGETTPLESFRRPCSRLAKTSPVKHCPGGGRWLAALQRLPLLYAAGATPLGPTGRVVRACSALCSAFGRRTGAPAGRATPRELLVAMSQEQAKDHGSDASLRSHSQGLCSRCDSDTHQLMRSRAVRAATSSQPDDACSRWERDAHWSWQVFIALYWPSFSVAVQAC